MKFYKCHDCKNIITFIEDAGVPVMSCGEEMKEMIPNSTDAAGEKHVPVVTVEGKKVIVNVGEVDHPMLDEHFITYVALESKQGTQIKKLVPGAKPHAEFMLTDDDELVAVYEYCNLHGLWKKEV